MTLRLKIRGKYKHLTKGFVNNHLTLCFQAGDCTAGNITSVTISDDAFPFGYDETQFGNCLSANVVRDNLGSLCEKIDDSGFQRVILDRLKEVKLTVLGSDRISQHKQDFF